MGKEIRVCDVCDEPIEEGDDYYEMPDGLTICMEDECLRAWAWEYRRCVHYSLT